MTILVSPRHAYRCDKYFNAIYNTNIIIQINIKELTGLSMKEVQSS